MHNLKAHVFVKCLTALIIYVYTMENCRYSTLAVDLLEKYNLTYVEHNVSRHPAIKDALLQKMQKIDKKNNITLPQVFDEGHYIGGYTELKKWIENDKNMKKSK